MTPAALRWRHTPALAWLVLALCVSAVLVGVSARGAGPKPAQPYADARVATGLRPGPSVPDYPWARERNRHASDPWGFPKRQCTSYVAWFLNTHGIPFALLTRGPAGVSRFGAARTWADAAGAAGFRVSTTPRVGSVAHWYAGEHSRSASVPVPYASGAGHVAVVYRVLSDDSVDVAEYDGETRRFQMRHDRAPRYLYIGLPL
jgi:surface antigen